MSTENDTSLTPADLDLHAGTVFIAASKSDKAHHVVLTDEANERDWTTIAGVEELPIWTA